MKNIKKLIFPGDFINQFICGDTLEVMKQIPDGSVGCVVTSPPYNLKNSTGNGMKDGRGGKWSNAALINGYSHYNDNMPHDEYAEWQRDCLTEMLRIIPEDGVIFYNHKWRVQAGLLQDRNDIVSGFPVRQIIIWRRSGGFNFNPGYFLPTYEVIYMIAKKKFRLTKGSNSHGDVWEFGQESKNLHPAPFPVKLIERVIASTNAETILDPFMGSGTTAVAAKKLKRIFIGIDLSPEYCEMSRQRLKDPSSILRPNPRRAITQTKLFEIEENNVDTFTKAGLVEQLKGIRDKGWIESGRPNNDGGVGNTLEDLLGIEENNLPIPNAAEWELKAQKKETSSLLTLFHMEPSPRALKFVPQLLLPEFGWSHKEAGDKYGDGEMSFRQTICAGRYSDRGFSVMVDRSERKVLIDFDPTRIDASAHPVWAKRVSGKDIHPVPYWGFDDLFHKAGTKLTNCFFVRAASKRSGGKTYFHYQDIMILQTFDQHHFIDALEKGDIYIDFDARTGHNHGTKFRLRSAAMPSLYATVTEY